MNVLNLKGNASVDASDYAKNLKSNLPSNATKGDDHATKATKAASDPIFLNNIRPDQAREFLLNNINRSIADYTPKPQSTQPTFVRSFPTAEATASQIIDTIGQAAKTIPATSPRPNLSTDNTAAATIPTSTPEAVPARKSRQSLEDLINKIQSSFQQTKEALDQLSTRPSGFSGELEQIQQKVNSFLEFLTDPQNNTPPSPTASMTETTAIAASYESYQSSSQTSIQIETRDGDVVTIDLANSFSQQQSVGAIQSSIQNNSQNNGQNRSQSSNFSGYVYEAYTEKANSFSFTVNGNLDEGELQAISALVGDIGKTIGQFEKGNIDAALNIAKNINTQSEELSNFSFNVQTSEQYRAIDLYQKTQVTTVIPSETTMASITTAPASSPLAVAQGNNTVESIFSNNISNIMSAAKNTGILNAAETVSNIFDKFYAQLEAQNSNIESFIALNNKHDENENSSKNSSENSTENSGKDSDKESADAH